jgi:hypothetical protein
MGAHRLRDGPSNEMIIDRLDDKEVGYGSFCSRLPSLWIGYLDGSKHSNI